MPALLRLPGISIVQASMGDKEKINDAVKEMDALIHVALDYCDGALNMLEHDTAGSVHLFEAAAKAGIKHIIYTSSTATCDFVYMTEYGRKNFSGVSLTEEFKPRPATFYGATKAATEMYLMALSHKYNVKMNIIRPGYIFGNPVVEGAPTQPDSRFADYVRNIKQGNDVNVHFNDGTQFLSAGHIAMVYASLLTSDLNRETFFVLGSKFISWERICRSLIEETGSGSKLVVEGGGTPVDENFQTFGVIKLKTILGLSFDNEWDEIQKHVHYLYSIV